MTESTELVPRVPDDGASATQLSILLSSATGAIDEEFKRSERLDGKSRNQITIAGSLFTVVQAVVVGLINGSLGGTEQHQASSFVLWLAVAGAVATAAIFVAAYVSYQSWKLRDDPTLSADTIRDYIDYAREGNPVVGVNLVAAYAEIAKGRRANNAKRSAALDYATKACGIAALVITAELVLAFVAVAVQ
jgi:prepilin signal peptidase PulO-like enzyme (type II secretory pathway)